MLLFNIYTDIFCSVLVLIFVYFLNLWHTWSSLSVHFTWFLKCDFFLPLNIPASVYMPLCVEFKMKKKISVVKIILLMIKIVKRSQFCYLLTDYIVLSVWIKNLTAVYILLLFILWWVDNPAGVQVCFIWDDNPAWVQGVSYGLITQQGWKRFILGRYPSRGARGLFWDDNPIGGQEVSFGLITQ